MTVADTQTRWPIVACTGHRIQHLLPLTQAQRDWTRRALDLGAVWLRDNADTVEGRSGMAVGTDLWWADAVVRAGLKLAAHIPHPDQTARWVHNPEAVAEWHRLHALRDPDLSRVYAPQYSVSALFQRNHGMLAGAAALLAVWMPHKRDGGTFDALCEAAKAGIPGVWINPVACSLTFQLPDPRRMK